MIEYIAEGKVVSVRPFKTRTLITLKIGKGRKSGELACRVTGGLSSRLKDKLRVGDWVVIRGETAVPPQVVSADSVMHVSR